MRLISMMAFTLLSCSALASDVFANYVGQYKITACHAKRDGQDIAGDPECEYQRVQVGKDARGVMRVTRSTNTGASVSEAAEVFQHRASNYYEWDAYMNGGPYQEWRHGLTMPDVNGHVRTDRTELAFFIGSNQSPVFWIKHKVESQRGKLETFYLYELVKE